MPLRRSQPSPAASLASAPEVAPASACARRLSRGLHALLPAQGFPMARPLGFGQYTQCAPSLPLYACADAWRVFTASTQISVAVRSWWRRRCRDVATSQPTYGSDPVVTKSMPTRAQSSGLSPELNASDGGGIDGGTLFDYASNRLHQPWLRGSDRQDGANRTRGRHKRKRGRLPERLLQADQLTRRSFLADRAYSAR